MGDYVIFKPSEASMILELLRRVMKPDDDKDGEDKKEDKNKKAKDPKKEKKQLAEKQIETRGHLCSDCFHDRYMFQTRPFSFGCSFSNRCEYTKALSLSPSYCPDHPGEKGFTVCSQCAQLLCRLCITKGTKCPESRSSFPHRPSPPEESARILTGRARKNIAKLKESVQRDKSVKQMLETLGLVGQPSASLSTEPGAMAKARRSKKVPSLPDMPDNVGPLWGDYTPRLPNDELPYNSCVVPASFELDELLIETATDGFWVTPRDGGRVKVDSCIASGVCANHSGSVIYLIAYGSNMRMYGVQAEPPYLLFLHERQIPNSRCITCISVSEDDNRVVTFDPQSGHMRFHEIDCSVVFSVELHGAVSGAWSEDGSHVYVACMNPKDNGEPTTVKCFRVGEDGLVSRRPRWSTQVPGVGRRTLSRVGNTLYLTHLIARNVARLDCRKGRYLKAIDVSPWSVTDVSEGLLDDSVTVTLYPPKGCL